MDRIETQLPGVCVIVPRVFEDDRGWFMESYSSGAFAKIGIDSAFAQDNHSFSKSRGTLRGLHFQIPPMAQAKLVRVLSGAILDVAVDLRRGSPTYLKWVSEELSSDNRRMLFIPRGFAHGFVTLTDDVQVEYKVDNLYSREHDRSLRFDEPSIGIDWGISDPVLSKKDREAPGILTCGCDFTY